MIKYYCDICRKEISYRTVFYNTLAKNSVLEELNFECCKDCLNKLKSYIKEISSNE